MSAPATAAGQTSTSSSTEEDALKAATFQRLHPRLYLERFLAEDVRPDGRAEDEFRGLAVNVGAFHTSEDA
jgi:exosome complex component RRP43